VEQLLTTSDNVLAESFGRLVAARRGLPPTFAGATRAVLDVLRELGVPVDGAALSDASGLSTLDRIAPATLVALLRAAADPSHPKLAPLLSGLPVAAFSGTLDERYTRGTDRGAAGEVRAKTGSLSIVTSLAGTVVDKDGRLLLFAFFAPVPESAATKAALDRAATALAGCGCRAPASPSAPAATSSSHPAAPASPDAATPSRPVATPR
jgi:D-alanyl-D-alanine carboxypeptidase/D-alanyl-D-alanine-endopeptidase (penicillin-binding protein 4)